VSPLNIADNLFLFSSYRFKSAILKNLINKYKISKNAQGLEFIPNPKDNLKMRNFKKVNMLFMNLIHNNNYLEILKTNHSKRIYQAFYNSALVNLDYDLKKCGEYVKNIQASKIIYESDKNHYQYINKRVHYKDISVSSILIKIKHKISKNAFKKALRAIENNKPLSESVQALINSYLKTIKTSTSKNTLSRMNRLKRRAISIKYGNQMYKVILKKSARRGYYLPVVESEFKMRLKNSYKLKIPEIPTI